MKYRDGQPVKVGDRVSLGSDDAGVVVAIVEEGEFIDERTRAQWSYLRSGAMIEFPKFGLIHYEELEADVCLVERRKDLGSTT